MDTNKRTWLYSLVAIFLCSCSNVSQRIELGEQLRAKAGLQKRTYQTRLFTIVSFQKREEKNTLVTFYIEGDGRAWINRRRVSENPTPTDPVALKLAIADKSGNVVYLARPCQFLELENEDHCQPEYWTARRASREVVDSMNDVITRVKQEYEADQIRLVGYSGGATVAAIIATLRDDVIDLRSVAGNLDISSFTDHHELTPLHGSINPASLAKQLVHIPQKHYYSLDDAIVVPVVIESYLSKLKTFDNDLRCVNSQAITGVGHTSGWDTFWNSQNHDIIYCHQKDLSSEKI